MAEVYVENDTSAYRRRSVTLPDGSVVKRTYRPEFRRLLEDVAAGLIDGVIAYDLDRVARDPRDLEDLIDVIEDRSIPARSVTGSLDLSNDSGVTMARVMLAVANKSSRDTARRVRRKQDELAAAGLTGGGGLRPYGYTRPGMVIEPNEAAVVREIADRVLIGESLNRIAEDLTTRGVPTVTGCAWSPRSVRAVVGKPTVAGLRVHRGEIIGKAAWAPILDQDTWARCTTEMERRAKSGNRNTLTRWLTDALECGKCGRQMVAWSSMKSHKYWCATPRGGCGSVSVVGPAVEGYVTELLLGYLSRPDNLERLRAGIRTSTVSVARAELSNDTEQLAELAELWADKKITTAEYLTARGTIEARVDRSASTVAAAVPSVVKVLANADDVATAWEALTPGGKRDVVRAVLGPLVVKPANLKGARVFDTDRLVVKAWAA